MGNFYNDGGMRFGSQTIQADTGGTTVGGVYTPAMQEYILESFSFTRGSNWTEKADDKGVPNKQYGRITIPTADSTLQLESESTKTPIMFAEIEAVDISGITRTLIVSNIGEKTGNEEAAAVSAQFRLKLNGASPVISSALTASGTDGTAFSYTVTASNTPTGFDATGLPSGLSINSSTGVISGTPTVSGVFNVTITATNAYGTSVRNLVITIAV